MSNLCWNAWRKSIAACGWRRRLRDRPSRGIIRDEDLIHAHYLRLKPIVAEILGGDADEETARLSSFSIRAVCLLPAQPSVVSRFYPEHYLRPETIEHVARTHRAILFRSFEAAKDSSRAFRESEVFGKEGT